MEDQYRRRPVELQGGHHRDRRVPAGGDGQPARLHLCVLNLHRHPALPWLEEPHTNIFIFSVQDYSHHIYYSTYIVKMKYSLK